MGVHAMRASSVDEVNEAMAHCMSTKGPHLIEVMTRPVRDMTNIPAPELSSELAPAIASAILTSGPLPAFDATMTLDEAYGAA